MLIHCWCECNRAQSLGNQFVNFLKNYTHIIWLSHSAPRYLFNVHDSISLHKDLYMNIHSSFICNSPKLKTAQMSMNWWMEKQKVIYPWGARVAQSVKRLTLDLGSGHDLTVSWVRVPAEPAWDSLPLSLWPSLAHTLPVSLKINK